MFEFLNPDADDGPNPHMHKDADHNLDSLQNVPREQVEDQVEDLEKVLQKLENKTERLDEDYHELLEKANESEGYARDKLIRRAYDKKAELEDKAAKKEELMDRLHAWRDVLRLMERSVGMDDGVGLFDSSWVKIEEVDVDGLYDDVEDLRRRNEEVSAIVEQMGAEVGKLAEDARGSRDRLERIREEAAATGVAGSAADRLVERDDQLAEDLERLEEESDEPDYELM